jgi:hypothetical protein
MVRHTRKKDRLFWPPKYYRGLKTRKEKLQRKREIEQHSKYDWKNPKAYTPFRTNTTFKTKKKSSYTEQWDKLFPDAKTLQERSQVTGVPVKYLQEVYNRGMAAWRTGHRPGMSQQAWSYPRVSSYLLCGKTHYTADADLVAAAKQHSKKAAQWFAKTCRRSPVKYNPSSK